MALRDAAPLLSLLSHELRAPAGVIGGYLSLLESSPDNLSPAQQQAVAGARRAQQRVVDILDDTSRLVALWRSPAMAPAPVSSQDVADAVTVAALPASLGLIWEASVDHLILLNAPASRVAEAVVAVAAAVAREHDTAVRLAGSATESHVVWTIRPATASTATGLAAAPFNPLRPGLGLGLVVAATWLAAAGATLHDMLDGGAAAGADVTFPRAR